MSGESQRYFSFIDKVIYPPPLTSSWEAQLLHGRTQSVVCFIKKTFLTWPEGDWKVWQQFPGQPFNQSILLNKYKNNCPDYNNGTQPFPQLLKVRHKAAFYIRIVFDNVLREQRSLWWLIVTGWRWWGRGPAGDNNPQQFEVSCHQIFTPVTARTERNINNKICQDFSNKMLKQRIKSKENDTFKMMIIKKRTRLEIL